MTRTILGTRIRERRRNRGLTQAALAQHLGISASYMNLIESNKRPIAGPLLRRTAEALDMRLDELDGLAERRLLESLNEIAHMPALADLGVESESAGELIGRYPGWARALASLARSARESAAAARAMADRIAHDPFLGEAVHRMLTRIAAVRSSAEILVEYPDIPPVRRHRFNRIIYDECQALSDVGGALAAYFDNIEETDRTLTPIDEVEALFESREHRFDEIEAAAASIALDLAAHRPSGRWAAAREAAEAELGPLIEQIIAGQDKVESAPARARARRVLTDYAARAILAPMPDFAARAAGLGYDVEALAQEIDLDIDTICHRLTALPRQEGAPCFGYFQANAAGTIVEMHGLPGLMLPRYAAACPLWVLFRAQQSPEALMRQRVVFPSGARFVFLAIARQAGPSGFGKPRHYRTGMIALSEADAALTAYGPGAGVPVEEVGPSCRICPRRGCPHRVDDPLSS